MVDVSPRSSNKVTRVRNVTAAFARNELFDLSGREHNEEDSLPPKVRELIEELRRAGFVDRGGKGNHRNFVHPKISRPITISGRPGDDAKHYQIRAVRSAIRESKE